VEKIVNKEFVAFTCDKENVSGQRIIETVAVLGGDISPNPPNFKRETCLMFDKSKVNCFLCDYKPI